jgi:hypothetical protein
MSVLCKTYPGERAARRAIEALTDAGVPARDIRLVIGHRIHDLRRQPAGEFAGTIGPDATVGRYAGAPRRRRAASGAFAGDPSRQRQGSFADADRDVIVTYERGAAHEHVAGDGAVRKLLHELGLDEHVIEELDRGRAVVIAEISDIASSAAAARLEQAAA